jgi:hypothetical protein
MWRDRRLPFASLYSTVEHFVQRWQPYSFCADGTSMGGQAIWEEVEAKVMQVARGCYCEDFLFSAKSKAELVMLCASRLEEGIAIPLDGPTGQLMNELRAYEWDDKGLQTDCVMALALAVKDFPPLQSVLIDVPPAAIGKRVTAGYQRIQLEDW